MAQDRPDAARNATAETGAETGLRERKKARRRQEIVDAAARLFSDRGIDATSLADIAHATGVSPPTVANYFGSKENILATLIFDGTQLARIKHMRMPRKTGCSFGTVLGDLLCECSQNTMRVAGKRVWRYVEATSIRRPGTDLQERLAYTDAELRKLIAAVLNDYAMVLRSGGVPDTRFIARLLFDRWTARYFAYIKDDAMPLATHESLLRADMKALASLLFDDGFAATSPLKPKGATT